MQVLLGITDPELHILDEFEDVEYERSTVEVSLMVNSLCCSFLFLLLGILCRPVLIQELGYLENLNSFINFDHLRACD